MVNAWIRRPAVVALASLWLLSQPRVLHANDVEHRDFSIFVDGKEAGQSRVTITAQADGTTVVAAAINVKIERIILTYKLNIEAMEWWKDGKLIGLKCASAENGKKTEVLAAVEKEQLRLRVNGKDRLIPSDVWTSSFWRLADAKYHNKQVPVLEADTGKEYVGQLQYIGAEQLTFMNQLQNCYHFRITGGSSPVDVWFDRYHRVVRQEFTESGHKTIVQLVSVRR